MRGDVHVRFGGECLETYHSDVTRRWVLTLLDFCFKHEGVTYNYPTIIFYQMGYSMFTNYQASRRHYRLNQKEECRTFYMAYRGTIQEVVISLIAEKMAATSAIQGKFSAEGLTAMAQGVDTRVRLAQALSNMDTETGKELQAMFDVINDTTDNVDDAKYKPMLLLSELIGEEEVLERTVEEMHESGADLSIFDMMDMFSDSGEDVVTETVVDGNIVEMTSREEEDTSIFSLLSFIIAGETGTEGATDSKATKKAPKRKGVVAGQMLLF